MARVKIPTDLHCLAGPAWLRDTSTAVTGLLPGYVWNWFWLIIDVRYAQIGCRGAVASPKNYSEHTDHQDSPRRRHCTRPKPQLMQRRSESVRDNTCGSRARTNGCRLYIDVKCSNGQPCFFPSSTRSPLHLETTACIFCIAESIKSISLHYSHSATRLL